MERQFQSKKRYLWAFIIGTAVFIFGFILVYSFSYIEYQRISDTQQKLSYEIFKDKLQYSLFNSNTCLLGAFDKISQDLRFQGAIIDDLEKKLGKNNENVLFKKKYYTLVELEHFEFLKQMNSKCNSNISSIFFFYSNKGNDIKKSEDAGKLLDSVSIRNKNLVIYSFDINLDDELISGLKEHYNITESPTMIINEKTKIIGPKNIAEIENSL